MRPEYSSPRIEEKPPGNRISVIAKPNWLAAEGIWSPVLPNPYDLLTCALIAALMLAAWFTFRDYAISNDEGVQHRYGELIIEYYRSGFRTRDLFTFQNLYLYGGLFDIVAVALANVIPVDPYVLRHILCAMMGISGVAARAALGTAPCSTTPRIFRSPPR